MFARHFHPPRFLRTVCGTGPFRDDCETRGIAFGRDRVGPLASEELVCWATAVEQLPRWYFLHHHALFHEVFVRHQFAGTGTWRTGRAVANVDLPDLDTAADRFAEQLRDAFRVKGARQLFCTADAHRMPDAVVFAAQVADRVRLVEGFSDQGEACVERVRPAASVMVAYEPASGRVRLKSPLRSQQRVKELFDRFGTAVLGVPVTPDPFVYDLDRLKRPLALLPDAPDMEAVRVKALHLRYPPHLARRRVCFETADGDGPTAVAELLAAHVGPQAMHDLTVSHAELQVRLRAGDRTRRYVVRLWPDRCSLNHTPFGDRMRECLRRWGLSRA